MSGPWARGPGWCPGAVFVSAMIRFYTPSLLARGEERTMARSETSRLRVLLPDPTD